MNLGDSFFVGALLIIAVIAVIGNILVILAVLSNRRLQNPANYLMVNLAVSDFFQGAVTMPMRGAEVLNTSNESLVRCDVVISLTILFHSASNFNLALIALDRFIAVSKPFAYATMVKTSSYKIVVALSWLLSLLISGCIVAGWRRHTDEDVGAICRFVTTLTDEYIIVYVILVDLIPLIVMLITYTYIFRTTRRQIRQIRDQEIAVKHAAINQAFDSRRPSQIEQSAAAQYSAPEAKAPVKAAWNSETVEANEANPREETSEGETSNNNNNNNQQTDAGRTKKAVARRSSKSQALSTTRTRKATRTVLAIIGFFIVLCLPISVIDAIELWCGVCGQIPRALITIALCMVSLNSCVNVFIYGGYNTDYRKAYWDVWHRARDAFLNVCSTGTKTTVQSVQSAQGQVASITT